MIVNVTVEQCLLKFGDIDQNEENLSVCNCFNNEISSLLNIDISLRIDFS